jgi:hypothetical protein
VNALLWLACALGAARGTDGVLELRLEGPLRAVHLDGVRVPTQVLVELAPAETITLRVPWLPADPSMEPKLRVIEGAGSARVEAIHPAAAMAPIALARRPLPRVADEPVRIPPVGWWLFAAGLIAVCAARRRPLSAVVIGGAFSLALALLPTRREPAPVVAVLEIGEFGAWWVHVGIGELEPPPLAHPALETQPEGANWEWVIEAGDPARPRRVARAGAGTLLVARSPGPEEVRLDAEGNGLESLEAVWRRSAAGEWTYHGDWWRGAALPEAREGGLLPTWLRAGAAPGARVVVGRFAEAPKGADEAWARAIRRSED